MPPEPGKTVVVDATVVISLAKAECLHLLGSLEGWAFVIPDQVVEEVNYPGQAVALEQALKLGHLRRESSTDPQEIAIYAELRQRMGRGEAACLAMAFKLVESARKNWRTLNGSPLLSEVIAGVIFEDAVNVAA